MGAGKAVTDATFTSDVLQSDKPVLVDFWAEWCAPCKKVDPLLAEIAKEMGDKVEIVQLNIDENPETTRAYRVMSVPTLTIFKGGEPVNSVTGRCSALGYSQLRETRYRVNGHSVAARRKLWPSPKYPNASWLPRSSVPGPRRSNSTAGWLSWTPMNGRL